MPDRERLLNLFEKGFNYILFHQKDKLSLEPLKDTNQPLRLAEVFYKNGNIEVIMKQKVFSSKDAAYSKLCEIAEQEYENWQSTGQVNLKYAQALHDEGIRLNDNYKDAFLMKKIENIKKFKLERCRSEIKYLKDTLPIKLAEEKAILKEIEEVEGKPEDNSEGFYPDLPVDPDDPSKLVWVEGDLPGMLKAYGANSELCANIYNDEGNCYRVMLCEVAGDHKVKGTYYPSGNMEYAKRLAQVAVKGLIR
jgi:hypothetical protein